MSSIKMVAEQDAAGRVKEIYEDIKDTLGIDFVPNMYRAMAPRPGFLEANWNNVKAVMTAPGQLDRLTREIIKPNSVSVSDSAHRCGLLLASVTRADTRLNQRPSALVRAWNRHGGQEVASSLAGCARSKVSASPRQRISPPRLVKKLSCR
jgi:hypothetical protein